MSRRWKLFEALRQLGRVIEMEQVSKLAGVQRCDATELSRCFTRLGKELKDADE